MPKILLGYLFSFLFIAVVILTGEIIHKKFNTDKEMTRKVEHVFTGFGWALCYAFFGPTYHLVVINAITLALLTALTFTGAMSSVERKDTKRSYGLLYFGISTMINILIAVYIDVRLIPLNAIAYFTLTLADGVAPISAKLAGGKNKEMFAPKTLVGFLSVFAMTMAVAAVASAVFHLSFSLLFIISVASVAALSELYGMKGLDNLTVPLVTFGYLVLHHYGLVTPAAQLAIVCLLPITVLASLSSSLTYYGGLISLIYFSVSAIIAPPAVVGLVIILFVLEAGISKAVVHLTTDRAEREKKKHKPRGAYQMVATVCVSFACAVVYAITDARVFLLAALVVIAEEFADSVASAMGGAAKARPIDILRFKRVECGISGGITVLGTISALVASFFAMGVVYCYGSFTPGEMIISAIIVFFGTVVDSILGSALQVCYRCEACGVETELDTHCSVPTSRVKGVTFIDNTTVNLLTGIITAIIAVVAMLIG